MPATYEHLAVSDGNGDAALMHVETEREALATTLDVDVVTNVPTLFIGSYGTLLPTGFIDPATKRDFYGHLDGTNLEIDGFMPGSTDDGNAVGDVVVIKPNTGWSDLVAIFINNMTGNGTPENITVADLSAEDIAAASLTLTGNLDVGGSFDLTGNAVVDGTSRLVPSVVVTRDVNNELVPDKQLFAVSALDGAATIKNPTWAALDFMYGELRIKDNGVARAITFDTKWVDLSGVGFTTTVAGKWTYISYVYEASTDRYHIRGIITQP